MSLPLVIDQVAEFFHDNYGRSLDAHQNKRNDEAGDAHECLDVVNAGLLALERWGNILASREVILANDINQPEVGLVNVDHDRCADQCNDQADAQQDLQEPVERSYEFISR